MELTLHEHAVSDWADDFDVILETMQIGDGFESMSTTLCSPTLGRFLLLGRTAGV